MDAREMIRWIVLLELSFLTVHAFNNRPVDHQRKILVRMVWPGGHVTSRPDDDTTPQPVVIPAATFSRQMVIRFPSSGSIHPDERRPSIVSSAGYDPFATEESADYSLDSYVSLSLSSGGSDAEGADQNLRHSNLRNEKSFDGGQLDFLQQLLRFAPSTEHDENSDQCNHPLHSWMCKNKAVVPSATNRPPEATTAQQQTPFFPGSSFENVQILIPDLSPTVVPPLATPPPALLAVQGRADEGPDSWTGTDPCNHPFHSWMCAKQRLKIIRPPAQSKETGASILDQNLLLPPLQAATAVPTTTTPPLAVTTKRSGWDGADPCTHPFHSWLCDKRQPVARTTSPRPLPAITTTASQPFVPDASFFIPDINPPAAPPTTTQLPPTTSVPLLIRTLAPKKGWDEADSCSHPFHSWLCEKPKMRTTTPAATTLAPPQEAVVFEPAPSMVEANQLVADASPPPTTTTTTSTTTVKPNKSSGWDEADSCSHPFHSWLCAKAPVKIRTTRPPTTTPAGQLPDASNFETLDALPLEAPQILTTQKPAVRVAPTEASGWADGADPCTHPFHSWLCNRSPSIKQNVKLGSNSRVGRQSDRAVQSESEALDEENLESSRWNTFESLRLPPSSVHPK